MGVTKVLWGDSGSPLARFSEEDLMIFLKVSFVSVNSETQVGIGNFYKDFLYIITNYVIPQTQSREWTFSDSPSALLLPRYTSPSQWSWLTLQQWMSVEGIIPRVIRCDNGTRRTPSTAATAAETPPFQSLPLPDNPPIESPADSVSVASRIEA